MRIRIIIDPQDADDPAVVESGRPFTLNVHRDDDDGTPGRGGISIGAESCLIGNDIGKMLAELSIAWQRHEVTDDDTDEPLPQTGQKWRTLEMAVA